MDDVVKHEDFLFANPGKFLGVIPHTVEITEILSNFFDKIFVKTTVLLKKLLKS